jgi:ferritin-like protein
MNDLHNTENRLNDLVKTLEEELNKIWFIQTCPDQTLLPSALQEARSKLLERAEGVQCALQRAKNHAKFTHQEHLKTTLKYYQATPDEEEFNIRACTMVKHSALAEGISSTLTQLETV